MANARNKIKPQPRERHTNSIQKGDEATLTQRIGLTQRVTSASSVPGTLQGAYGGYGEWLGCAIEKAGAELMQMTPLERINRRHPTLWLHPLAETHPLRDLGVEPDPTIGLEYYRRFMAASESRNDDPANVLLEFLRKYPLEFDCSGWVLYAFGYLVLGYPRPRDCESRAKRVFFHYWRATKSPKPAKRVQQLLRMSKASKILASPHVAHCRRLLRWMDKAAERGIPGSKWFDEYVRSHPNMCSCLSELNFRALRKAYVRIARRYGDSPPPSAVVLEAVAAAHHVSSRALAGFRADARKRSGKSQ